MPWKHILSIKINDSVIYAKDIVEKNNYIDISEDKILDKNNINCEIISNMEVLKHAGNL